ncbi:MAG: 30S ribosomal protein S20 [Patescibacteria group bacterium]
MPKIKSAQKALRQNARRRTRNLQYKKRMQEVIKKYRKLVLAEKFEDAKKILPLVYKTLDKLTKVDFIKRGKADRIKSRLSKKISKR